MSRNPARAIYGVIAVATVLAAEGALQETFAKTILGTVITITIYWLAHSYAEFAAVRLASGGPLSLTGLGHAMQRELPLLMGASVPLGALLIWAVAGASLNGAINAAIFTSAGLIVVVEIVAGIGAKLSGREFVKQVTIGAVLGLLVIALKLVLH